jgi:hypothetical protein
MKPRGTYTAGIIGVAIGLFAGTAFAETTAAGPYYANPSWDQTLPANTRFIVLSNMNSEAVLDRETGLVWERSPSLPPMPQLNAQGFCNVLFLGNRLGWRLPQLQELLSLIDRSQSSPALPAGHPFNNVSNYYWTATTSFNANQAYGVSFGIGAPIGSIKSSSFSVWCVRGGAQGLDPQ